MKLIWDTGETKEIPVGYKIVGQQMHYARPERVSLTCEELLYLIDHQEYIKHLVGALGSGKKQ